MNDITALREALSTPPPGGTGPDLATLTRAGRRLRHRRRALVGGCLALVATAAVVTPMLVAGGGTDAGNSVVQDPATSPTTSTTSTASVEPSNSPGDIRAVGLLIALRAETLLPGLEVDQSFPDDLTSTEDPSAPGAPINWDKVVGWHAMGTTPAGTPFYVLTSWSEGPPSRDCGLYTDSPDATCTIGADAEGRRLDVQEGPPYGDSEHVVRIVISYRETAGSRSWCGRGRTPTATSPTRSSS